MRAQKNPLFQQLRPKVDLEIGSLHKFTWSENPAGFPRIPLEFQPLSADSPLVGGVLNSYRHLSMQLLSSFGLRRMWDGFNSGKQPVQSGYQFPKRGFAFLPVFEGQVGRATDPIDEVFGHPLSLDRFHPTLPLAGGELGAAHRFYRGMSQNAVGPRTTSLPI